MDQVRGHLSGGHVELELGPGRCTLTWPDAGVTLGPCVAAVTLDGTERTTTGGVWRTEAGAGFGRSGTWARWLDDDGVVTIDVHVPDEGDLVVVGATVAVRSAATLDCITPFVGPTDLRAHRRLVDGYDSWAYSGVRGDEATASWWDALLVAPDGRALGIHALDASRLATRVLASDGSGNTSVRVECGATPTLEPVGGTWGYLVGDPPGLGLPLAAGESVGSAPIAIGARRSAASLGEDLAALAASSMRARRWRGGPIHGWESWYHYGLFVSADDVLANARVLRERYADRPGFDLVQIDDGWQRTYGAWWPNERFPDDLGALVDQLHSLGCRAGLWLAPFRVQPDAPGIATDHPEWCLRDRDGAPVREPRANAWALDASRPDACDWVHELGTTVRAWGFEMVKVDFCYLAALEAARHDPRCTGIEALRRGLGALADGLGDDVYVLGCGMPMLPAVGICHGNRVGHDLAMPRVLQELGHPLDAGWTGFAGVRAQARNVAARWAQASRWYDADPEVVMAWGSDGSDPTGYTTEEARTIATMVAVCGGPFLLADELVALRDDERAVIECADLLRLLGDGPFRPVDLFEQADAVNVPQHAFAASTAIPRVWETARNGDRLVAIFNWDDAPMRVPTPDDLIGGRELWTGVETGPALEIPAHGVRLVRGGG